MIIIESSKSSIIEINCSNFSNTNRNNLPGSVFSIHNNIMFLLSSCQFYLNNGEFGAVFNVNSLTSLQAVGGKFILQKI